MSEDCYVYVDGDKVRVQCVECHEKNKLGQRWRAMNGYGPWDYVCECGRYIHKNDNKEEK